MVNTPDKAVIRIHSFSVRSFRSSSGRNCHRVIHIKMTFAELLRTYSCLPNDSNERLTALENSPKYATSVEKLW